MKTSKDFSIEDCCGCTSFLPVCPINAIRKVGIVTDFTTLRIRKQSIICQVPLIV